MKRSTALLLALVLLFGICLVTTLRTNAEATEASANNARDLHTDQYQEGCKLYYNSVRKYNSTTMETTRTPNMDGYYVYTMYCEGRVVEVKTKDKAIANIIDAQIAPIVALQVSNGIVKAAYPAICGVMYGVKCFNYNYVGEITADKTVSCYYFSNGERKEASASYKMAADCEIYNVSTNYEAYCGEKTTLQVGDQIQAIRNDQSGELTHIWVMNRIIDAPLYVHTNWIAPTYGVTNRVPDAEGYYSVDLFADGKISTFRTKDQALMSAVDAYGSGSFFTIESQGDILLKVEGFEASAKGRLVCANYDIMGISGKNVTAVFKHPGSSSTGKTKEFTYTDATKVYDICSYSPNRFREAQLEEGDRITVFSDDGGNIAYIFIVSPHTRQKGYETECSHCGEVVWWEPWTGSCITTAGDQVVHYYMPTDYTRAQSTIGKNVNTDSTVPRFTAVIDLNGTTTTSTHRNFIVYYDLVLIDSVGGGVLQANGYQGGSGGNFMVAGGTVTVNDGITLRQNASADAKASNGGNFVVSNLTVNQTGKTLVGKVILNDAKLEGWDCADGGNIKLNAGAELTIQKATVTGGDIQVAADAKVKLNGSQIKIGGEGIDLTSGAKLAESKLSGSSRVTVQANGSFTEALSDADAQKAFYVAERRFYPIEVRDSALWTDRDPSKPDYMEEPEVPALPEVLKVDNSALVLDANDQAKCPVCNQVVTWTAISDASKAQSLLYGHYYLTNDIAYEAADLPYIQVASGVTACLHLNDHNIIASNAQAVHVNGTLSVMGNGTVSGNGFANFELISTRRPDLHAATLEANGSKAVVNLYGGTYIKSAENDARMAEIVKSSIVQEVNCANYIVEVHGNGGTINMFEGAVVDGRNVTKKGAVMSYWGMFNLYGGTVYGGTTTAVQAGNWTDVKSGNISIYGGTIQAGTGDAVRATGVKTAPASIAFYGGTVKGTVGFNANAKVVLAGNPVLTRLSIPSNKDGAYKGLVILGKLTDGASISVTGTADISHPCENAEAYLQYFKSLTDTPVAIVDDAIAFYYVPDPVLPEIPEVMPAVTENLQFIGGSDKALCPLCKEFVQWTPVTQKEYGEKRLNDGATLGGGTHYYLAEDVTYTGTSAFMNAPGGNAARIACFHLNGHNFTAANANFAHGSYGTLNILGSGTVTGNGKSGAAVTINTNKDSGGGIFLHAGTYTKAAGNENGVVQVNTNGGRIWVGPDATIQTKSGQLAAKVAGGGFDINGMLIIEGTVEGGYVQSVASSDKGTGKVVLELKDANLQGGAIIAEDTLLGLFGQVQIAGLDLTSGAKVLASELSGGALVEVKADGLFTEPLDNADSQLMFYRAIHGYYSVQIRDGALWTADDPAVDELPPTPEDPDVPPLPEQPEQTEIDNSNLVLDANNRAKCPVCGEVVQWTAITDVGDRYHMVGGVHYYLANDIVYELENIAIGISYNRDYKGLPACLHLNGHNITATKGIAVYSGIELNIMGNGIVSGNGKSSGTGAALQVNSAAAIVNVYGGTYRKYNATTDNPVVNMGSAGGVLNIFPSVEISCDGTEGNAMQSVNGTVNIYGGEIRGAVIVPSTVKFTIAGNPVMTELVIDPDAKITLGQLEKTARITVDADGVFTQPIDDAQVYMQYFTALDADKMIIVESKALSCVGTTEEPDVPDVPDVPDEPEVPVVIGDVDSNGTVDTDDAIYLLQHVLMPALFPLGQSADFDDNGAVDVGDAIYLLQHVLMPSLFPLK